MKSMCWIKKRQDSRNTNWHIMDQNFKDIYFMTLCNVQMSLDEEFKYENDEDYKWQFGHYFVPEKVCNKCQKVFTQRKETN